MDRGVWEVLCLNTSSQTVRCFIVRSISPSRHYETPCWVDGAILHGCTIDRYLWRFCRACGVHGLFGLVKAILQTKNPHTFECPWVSLFSLRPDQMGWNNTYNPIKERKSLGLKPLEVQLRTTGRTSRLRSKETRFTWYNSLPFPSTFSNSFYVSNFD